MPVLILTKVVVVADFPRLQYVVVTQPWASAFALIPRFLAGQLVLEVDGIRV